MDKNKKSIIKIITYYKRDITDMVNTLKELDEFLFLCKIDFASMFLSP